MMPLGSTAQVIRLRRRNPIIEVGLNAVRQIVGPVGSFMIVRKQGGKDDEESLEKDDNEFGDIFSLDYELSMSMSIASDPFPTEAPSEKEQIFRRQSSRFRKGLFRRQSGGILGNGRM
ncbi:hypothetical protein IV203_031375 [Nitzschia inconspicua]|uniref:Uncharacterized protein n=1 Tax=Nitzschia inconspicua TaxID=303405 RepID=A0A9K3LV31_9STRA|nr:hypothetical protein IV203_031375 [Nitzschia inconspicua]